MACPYFWPVERHGGFNCRESMMPLGAVWSGSCRASEDQPWTPDDMRLRPLCNLGYARGNCDRFPPSTGPDAVRFTIARDDGATVGVVYVIERNHHPGAHGSLDYLIAGSGFTPATVAEPILLRQAHAYIETYLGLRDGR